MNQDKLIKENVVKNIDKYDTIVKVVKSHNKTSGRVYLPTKYINKEVVILVEK
jgi:hypothetical protein